MKRAKGRGAGRAGSIETVAARGRGGVIYRPINKQAAEGMTGGVKRPSKKPAPPPPQQVKCKVCKFIFTPEQLARHQRSRQCKGADAAIRVVPVPTSRARRLR